MNNSNLYFVVIL